MPNDDPPPRRKRRHRLGISRKKPVKFNGKGWVFLNDAGNGITIIYETEIDSSQQSKLRFKADPAPHTESNPGE